MLEIDGTGAGVSYLPEDGGEELWRRAAYLSGALGNDGAMLWKTLTDLFGEYVLELSIRVLLEGFETGPRPLLRIRFGIFSQVPAGLGDARGRLAPREAGAPLRARGPILRRANAAAKKTHTRTGKVFLSLQKRR